MDWTLIVLLLVMFQPSLSVLFTVEAERNTYQAEFGGDVVMGCRFLPKLPDPYDDLKVTWHRISPSARNVYRIDNGTEDVAFQAPDYRGRVRLLTEELKDSRAKLEVSRLRISDSGTYQCLVQTEEGADYKTIILAVTAPYKAVTKHIETTAEGAEVLLTCRSAGHPRSDVTWQSGNLQGLDPNTTTVSTSDQLFEVTSQIRVSSSVRNNYTCFTKDGASATFHIPDEIPRAKSDALIVLLSIGVIMVVISIAVLVLRRRKGSRNHSTRNLLDGRDSFVSAAACLQVKNEEEITIFNEGCTEENLRAVLKARYSDSSFGAEERRHRDGFSAEELHRRLQNNHGQPASLQALLPDAGEVLLIEGPPDSGKTTVAHILVSSWSEGPAHALSSLLDLGALRLLLYVDCSEVKGDLFEEVTTQLSLAEKAPTEDELRTVLSRSSGALLLLDGYREGSRAFDESLGRFLSERGGCRVLVLACPGHCPVLRDTVQPGGVLRLQTQTAKY